jgi:hypothetical protein
VDQLRGCKAFTNNASPIQPLEAKYDATKRVNYANLKTQCVYKFKELAERGMIRIETQDVAMREEIEEEIAQWRRENPDDDQKIRIVPKDVVKERLGRSPDVTDTFIFRMVYELEVPNSERPTSEKRTSIRIKRKFFNPQT